MSDYLAPAFAVVLPNLGGIAGGFLTRRAIPNWYENLQKPSWRPPNWAFGPVWTYLYSSMGYASYLVWRDGGGFEGENRLPLALFGTQLALNWAWTPIFFGAKSLKWGLIEITVLWGAIAGTIFTFYPVSKLAAGLLVPYLGWVTLASALTYTIWRDNKDRTD
ncbi:translocator protein-like [Littorina saxatilis]|uniref:Translocator protein n=1 Tax=Littorina saxatilis TaxID=31220 RepID=A0AAN9GGI5_9CAEN